MYTDNSLTNHLQTSSSLSIKSKIIAEWNLNNSETIKAVGNFKNRPTAVNPSDTVADNKIWNPNENELTSATNEWYGYTDYDTVIDGGYTDENLIPITFRSSRERQKSLMSLEDCFGKFRPRSGINKLRTFDKPVFGKNKSLIPILTNNTSIFLGPRYYVANKDDKFKYWSSYRTELSKTNPPIETRLGISGEVANPNILGSDTIIQDAAPFVIYQYDIPTNKIVVKIQTNVSNNNAFVSPDTLDPFYAGSVKNYKSTPLVWKIQKYTGSEWITIYSTISDEFIGDMAQTGYFQLSYGLTNTEVLVTYKDSFVILGTVSSTNELPLIKEPKQAGQAYLVKTSTTDKGTIYVYNGGISDTALLNYSSFVPIYGWYKSEESVTNASAFVTELDKVQAPSFVENSATKYREFEYIQGLRIVVNKMANTNTTFDLIELSPRLETDITDIVSSFGIKKFASDIGVSNLPVGQLLSSTGDLSIFDYNQVFNTNNQNSLLNIYSGSPVEFKTTLVNKGLQFKFYEIVSNVPENLSIISKLPQPSGTTNITITTEQAHGVVQNDTVVVSGMLPAAYNGIWTAQSGTSGNTLILNIGSNPGSITKAGTVMKTNTKYKDYYIPIKTLYSDGFPQYSDTDRNVSISLRDLSFYFESCLAPEILIKNASVSYIVATLLDSIGFSNYKFLRAANISDSIIPYFMVPPDKNVMEVLQELAKATQTIMFFDEMNNFVVMQKEYLLPESSNIRAKDISLYGFDLDARKANIQEVKSESNDIYNDGKIVYYNRYIKKATNDLETYSILDRYQVFEYERNVLWQLEATEKNTQSKNEQDLLQTAYSLSSIPLASSLSATPPSVENGVIKNNEIDFGDGVYWLSRYNGYFYSNGEIIRYDAVQYATEINNNVNYMWITSGEEYQREFAKLGKGNKMYKTGKVRIYTQPEYNSDGTLKNTAEISKHGRKQFGTTITSHNVPNDLLGDDWWEKDTNKKCLPTNYSILFNGENSALVNSINKEDIPKLSPTITTKIDNFLAKKQYNNKRKVWTTNSQIQSSGIVVAGPTFQSSVNNIATISSVTKPASDNKLYDTFGTRLRILGEPAEDPNYVILNSPYSAYSFPTNTQFINKDGIVVNSPNKVAANSCGMAIMTNTNGEGYYYELVVLNYTNSKVIESQATTNTLFFYKLKLVDGILTPVVLYQDFQNIIPDTGKFTSKVLKLREEDAIYDIAVSVDTINKSFGIYFNNNLIATINDTDSTKLNNLTKNVSLFVRGSTKALFENVYRMRRILQPNEINSDTTDSLKLLQEQNDISGVQRISKISNSNLNIFDTTIFGLDASKNGLTPLVQTGFLSQLSASNVPEVDIDYEEFGAIMRECAYFNIKFDKAYPALTSLISPIPASLGGYVIAGYSSTPYRAEFLVFNVTDSVLDLGANQSYLDNLNITGVTFTEQVPKDLTVDEFLNKKANPLEKVNYNPATNKKQYVDIKNNRLLYGIKSFVIDSPYVQNEELATNLMSFLINKLSKPRKAIGVSVFGMPIIQLGDIVSLSFDTNKVLPSSTTSNNFVVYAMEYQRKPEGPSTILYLSEVI